MRKLVAALALSTSVLATTSIYLWKELRDARGRLEMQSHLSVSPRPGDSTSPQQHETVQSASVAAPQSAMPVAMTSTPDVDAKTRQRLLEEDFRDNSRQKLVQLSDPTMRAQMLEEWKEANSSLKSKYARYLDISEADAERLMDILAEQQLATSEAFARCNLRPPCDYQAVDRETSAVRQAALNDLLGAEKQQRYEQYQYSNIERGLMLRYLRDKLPAGSDLTEEESERLVAALAEERKLVEAEIKQGGGQPFSQPMQGVAFTFSDSPFQAGKSNELLKEAADYNRRIHARAKRILTAQQLAAFEQVQDAAIVRIKFWLREQERDVATRSAAVGESR